ncbi:hypothetical protein PENTCL1PPCAC_14746, partial [Pristionchus entomophagus]
LLIEERLSNPHSLCHLEEGECHPASDDHLVHLIEHVLDQLNLVGNLRPSQYHQERPGGIVEGLYKVIQFILHEKARGTQRQLDSDQRTAISMGVSEGVVDVDISKSGEGGSVLLDCSRVRDDLHTDSKDDWINCEIVSM